MVDMEKNEGPRGGGWGRRRGGNDRKADSCGETERTKITTERGRKGGRNEERTRRNEVRKKRRER